MKIVQENPDGMTLEEVGDVLGVTRERVRQIQEIAIDKLRRGREAGAGESVDFGRFAFALVECETCGEYFVRDGAATLCPACEPEPIPPNMPCHCFDEIAARKPPKPRRARGLDKESDDTVTGVSVLFVDFFGGFE